MVANSVEQMLADMLMQDEVTNEDVRKIRMLLSEASKLSMVNEVSIPKVGTSRLSPTNTCKKFKVQVYIYMHNYLDEVDMWRKTISLEKATKGKTQNVASKIELMVESIMTSLFNNMDKHDFAEAMELWIAEIEKDRRVSRSTISAYKDRFKVIKRYFEDNPVYVEDFSADTMEDFCDWALSKGRVKPIMDWETGEKNCYKLTRRTVRDLHGLIFRFFTCCKRKYGIPKNPCFGTKVSNENKDLKNRDQTEAAWMDLDVYKQFKQWLIDNTDNIKYAHLKKVIEIAEVGIQTGMRREEICGLHWDKVSFDKRTIRISQTRIITEAGVKDRNRVKTDSSYRIYKMTESLYQCLLGMKQRQLENGLYNPQGFVFMWENPQSSSYCKPYDPGYMSKIFKKAVVACPYTSNDLHLHSLRHSACSICYKLGWTIEEARDWLGHGSTDITEAVYNHYRRQVGMDKVKMLEDAFA